MALKVPVVAPAATVIEAGTVNTVFVLVSVTAAPPVGATCVKVTVQVLDAFCPKLVGLHTSDDTVIGATRLIVALAELLLYVAVTVALWLLAMVFVVALKVPVVAPAATVIEAGTVNTVLVLVSVTAAPPVGAACVSVTVQVLEAFCPKLVGLHASEDTVTGATRLTVALAELLLYVAVTVALPLLAMVFVVALNVPVVAPAATVIEAGTVSTVLVLVSVTAAPPVGRCLRQRHRAGARRVLSQTRRVARQRRDSGQSGSASHCAAGRIQHDCTARSRGGHIVADSDCGGANPRRHRQIHRHDRAIRNGARVHPRDQARVTSGAAGAVQGFTCGGKGCRGTCGDRYDIGSWIRQRPLQGCRFATGRRGQDQA